MKQDISVHAILYVHCCHSDPMRFEWDEEKNRHNGIKHKISFEAAIAVFDDPFALSVQDRVADGEERWQTLGLIGKVVLLIVAHTWEDDDGDEVIRIISARKATRTERQAYEENRKASRD